MHSQHLKVTSEDVKYQSDTFSENDVINFHYNSDLSGCIHIEAHRPDIKANFGFKELYAIKIPGWMVLEFVGRFVNSELQSNIENMSGRETLVAIQRMLD